MSTQFIYISWNIKDINKVLKDKSIQKSDKKEAYNNFSAFANITKKTF